MFVSSIYGGLTVKGAGLLRSIACSPAREWHFDSRGSQRQVRALTGGSSDPWASAALFRPEGENPGQSDDRSTQQR